MRDIGPGINHLHARNQEDRQGPTVVPISFDEGAGFASVDLMEHDLVDPPWIKIIFQHRRIGNISPQVKDVLD